MTLILTRSDVRGLLDYGSCIEALETAFRADSTSQTVPAGVLGTHVPGGGFHVKTAGMNSTYAAKINANFPDNPSLRGLPTVQGVLCLFDAADGRLLALIDSMELTSIRTAAASAVAAKYLARKDAASLMVIGCGTQGVSHLRALSRVADIDRVFAYDSDFTRAESYAAQMKGGWEIVPLRDFREKLVESDLVVTCTTSRTPLLEEGDVAPGTFIAAVGADNESKWEIGPKLMASAIVVVDVLDQCEKIGDLHHAIEAGAMSRDDVHADLADVVGGKRRGRSSNDEVIVFDSTGTALEDVAAASVVYERAISEGRGVTIDLGT